MMPVFLFEVKRMHSFDGSIGIDEPHHPGQTGSLKHHGKCDHCCGSNCVWYRTTSRLIFFLWGVHFVRQYELFFDKANTS